MIGFSLAYSGTYARERASIDSKLYKKATVCEPMCKTKKRFLLQLGRFVAFLMRRFFTFTRRAKGKHNITKKKRNKKKNTEIERNKSNSNSKSNNDDDKTVDQRKTEDDAKNRKENSKAKRRDREKINCMYIYI